VDRPTHLVVGLLKKPHGIKGEALIYPVTDEPEAVFRAGRVLVVVDAEGRPTGQEVEVVRARPFHRAWLLHFAGFEAREPVDALRERFLALRAEDVRELGPGEFYHHELVGMVVQTGEAGGVEVGVVAEVIEAPQGPMLSVKGAAKEHLIPFAPWLVRRVDRTARRIEIAPPPGLLEV
jgi:16S rRNA processing protein RimM